MADIIFTKSAQSYLAELLKKQKVEGVGIRVFINQPGTPSAETCIAYCKPNEQKENDKPMVLEYFTAWIDAESESFLEEAIVDYGEDRMGGQLTIKAPNSKVPNIDENSSLEQKINYFLSTEINPSLAAHGGMIQLVEVIDEVAVLQFGGGCQGCGMVDVTLKEGVEKTLMAHIPELKGVQDVTDHSETANAYYK